MKDAKRVKKERNLSAVNESNVIAANLFLDSENSHATELTVTRRDLEKPLASLRMMGAGTNDFQGVLAISTVNSGTPGGPLVERMRIHTNGYLGIGTDNPKTPLHIPEQGLQIGTSAQASDNFHIVSDLTGNARGLRLFNGNYGAGTPLLTVLANGNVGIGINPNHKLDINGDLKLQSGAAINEFSTDGTLFHQSDSAVPTEKAVRAYVDKIQSGSVGINENEQTGSGIRIIPKTLKFGPFARPPTVVLGVVALDVDHNRNTRYSIWVESITNTGCIVKFQVWADTYIYSLSVNWMAYGPM